MARMLVAFGTFSFVLFSKIENIMNLWPYLYRHQDPELVHKELAWNPKTSIVSTKITANIRWQPGCTHPHTYILGYALMAWSHFSRCPLLRLSGAQRINWCYPGKTEKELIVPLLHLLQKLVGVGQLSFERVHFSDVLKLTRVSDWACETSRFVLRLSV